MNSSSVVGFECVLCLESLNNSAPPAPIPDPNKQPEPTAGNSAGTSRPRKKKKVDETPEYLAEICATWCGHMFHRACLDRWIYENWRRKTCPSCKKSVSVAQSNMVKVQFPRAPGSELPSTDTAVECILPFSNCILPGSLQLREVLVKDCNEVKNHDEDALDENESLNAEKDSVEEEFNRLKKGAASQGNDSCEPPILIAEQNLPSTAVTISSPSEKSTSPIVITLD